MRSVRLSIEPPAELTHPMHRFVQVAGAVEQDRLLYSNLLDGDRVQLLFYVEGDRDAYVAALDEADPVISYEVAPLGEASFYVLVQERWTDEADVVVSLLQTADVVHVPPVEFTADGALRVTLVGTQDGLQTVFDRIPDDLTVDIERLSAYEEPVTCVSASLTARQREAVAAAVDVGYYAVPREGTVEDVADVLDCAPSTASNHLRKAQAAVMSRVV